MGEANYPVGPSNNSSSSLLHDSPLSDEPSWLPASDGLLARASGEWARRKLRYLHNYCRLTTTATEVEDSPRRFVFLDVMAGSGMCRINETGEEFPGSPLVALENDFSEYIFIEEEPDLAHALHQRVANHPKAGQIRILNENWVDVVNSSYLNFDPSVRVVAFIDPPGIARVPISALRTLARNPSLELLVSIHHRLGIIWNTHQYRRSTEGQTALNNFLGDQSWLAWNDYDAAEFGRLVVERFSANLQNEGFVDTRHISVPENNPLYRLTLFSRRSIAQDFWQEVLKIDEQPAQPELFP